MISFLLMCDGWYWTEVVVEGGREEIECAQLSFTSLDHFSILEDRKLNMHNNCLHLTGLP